MRPAGRGAARRVELGRTEPDWTGLGAAGGRREEGRRNGAAEGGGKRGGGGSAEPAARGGAPGEGQAQPAQARRLGQLSRDGPAAGTAGFRGTRASCRVAEAPPACRTTFPVKV
ncbi:uncharacterized protein LOC133625143 [Colius striatus]|uniref:uncharacterized protein LOC133625143 n=1 Tax=Colius striatus TaxID=57412 RepID=UPI002B1D7DD7|nr:uncharacterized protein LOC133625143 [Colius striatus]